MIQIPGGLVRTLLAMLLSRRGEVVARTDIIDALWSDGLPRHARKSVQLTVLRLRRVLGEQERIVWTGGGYAIRLQPDELDAQAFTDGVRAARSARAAGNWRWAAELFQQALALWRGTPYVELKDNPFLAAEIQHISELRLQAAEELADLDIQLGRHAEVVPALTALTGEYPDRERLSRLLMVALHKAGHQTRALEVYRNLRRTLIEEHGVEPSAEVRSLHRALLRGELDQPPKQTRITPSQLPPDISSFVGRGKELARLDAIAAATNRQPTAVVIMALSGTAGVGKTVLAVHWAHRVADRFPDGQLYMNLRGFDPSGAAMNPSDAVRGFLDALGVAPQRIPADLESQAALYRSLISGQRVLVVLDNAHDLSQIRPLLPGTRGCLAIVTSRNDLSSLVATTGAAPLALNLFTITEARQLLNRVVGEQRANAEPDAVADIITSGTRLPLALAIVAARAATDPGLSLTALAASLRNAHRPLDVFSSSDASTDMRTVFSWSYQRLSPDAARLFRFLGLHPGPDISPAAAASLAGHPREQVRHLIDELTNAHLLNEHQPRRYAFHDLLRAFAHELVLVTDTEADRTAASRRMLDHYLHTAYASNRLLEPQREPIALGPRQPDVIPEQPVDYHAAMAWFSTEQSVLLAAIDHAAGAKFHTEVWQLAWTLVTYLDRRGLWHHLADAWRAALHTTQQFAAGPAQARAHRGLAHAYTRLSRPGDAERHLYQALDLHRELGDRAEQAHTHIVLAVAYAQQNRYTDALEHDQQAFNLFQHLGHRPGQARALNMSGWHNAQLGRYREALALCEQALALYQELGDRAGQAATWDSLGYAHHHLRQYQVARYSYQQALDHVRELGSRYNEADTLTHLGETQQALNDHRGARQSWQQALKIFEELDHPNAALLATKLQPWSTTNA